MSAESFDRSVAESLERLRARREGIELRRAVAIRKEWELEEQLRGRYANKAADVARDMWLAGVQRGLELAKEHAWSREEIHWEEADKAAERE